MPIRLIQAASFDPETIRLLGLAYDRACEFVAPDMNVREALARRIIEAARRGERDVEKLIEYGLGRNGPHQNHVCRQPDLIAANAMQEPIELSYRVFNVGSDWYWELRQFRRDVLAHGTAETSAKARARAVLAALTLMKQGHPEHDTPAFIDYREESIVHRCGGSTPPH